MSLCEQCGAELQLGSAGELVCPGCAITSESRHAPSLSDYLRRFPATSLFLALNILVFAAMCLSRVSPTSPSAEQLVRWGANSGEKVLFYNQWWRVLTSAFVHIGAPHLITNMWSLWLLGTLAEAVLGTYLYGGVYVVCAIGGSLTSLYWKPLMVGAGASGALMGILGALVSVLKFAHLPVPKDVVRSTTRSLLTGAALTLVIGLFPRIDNAAHVGGLVCGLLIGLLLSLSRNADYVRQRRLRWLCLMLPLVLLVPFAVATKQRAEPLLHYEQALNYLQSSHYSLAEQEARVVLKKLPQNTEALELLSTALFYQGNNAEAGKYLRQLIAQDAKNSFATNALARIELNESNLAGVQELLNKALPLQPRNAEGRVYLGTALQALNKDNEAIQQYRAAVQIKPDLYDAQMALGSIYEKHREDQQAILFYRRAGQLQPDQLEPLRGLARVYLASGRQAEADQTIAEIRKREQSQNRTSPTRQ